MDRLQSILANQKPLMIIVLLAVALVLPVHNFKIVQIRSSLDGAPQRPEHFRNIEQLNKYLSELTDYYTVLGRPRFGKRSEPLRYAGYEEEKAEADPRPSLTLAELLLGQDYDRQR